MQYTHHHACPSGTPFLFLYLAPDLAPLTTVTDGSRQGHVMQAEPIRILPWEFFSLELEEKSLFFSGCATLLSRNFFPTHFHKTVEGATMLLHDSISDPS